jgi:hypothetical protein
MSICEDIPSSVKVFVMLDGIKLGGGVGKHPQSVHLLVHQLPSQLLHSLLILDGEWFYTQSIGLIFVCLSTCPIPLHPIHILTKRS